MTAAGILRLHHDDNVAVAARDLRAGDVPDGLVTQAAIPSGHEVATRSIAEGGIIRKYGQPIGFRTPGESTRAFHAV